MEDVIENCGNDYEYLRKTATFAGGASTPQFADRQRIWSELQVSPCGVRYPETEKYLEALREVFRDGRVRFCSFRFESHPVFDWYAERCQYYEMGFFEGIWKVPAIKALMPEPLMDLNFFSRSVFVPSDPFVLGGKLAMVLFGGGPYQSHADGPGAKILGEAVASELVHDDYGNVLLFESYTAWSAFFMDVAWDPSWVVIDQRKRLIHILAATCSD